MRRFRRKDKEGYWLGRRGEGMKERAFGMAIEGLGLGI